MKKYLITIDDDGRTEIVDSSEDKKKNETLITTTEIVKPNNDIGATVNGSVLIKNEKDKVSDSLPINKTGTGSNSTATLNASESGTLLGKYNSVVDNSQETVKNTIEQEEKEPTNTTTNTKKDELIKKIEQINEDYKNADNMTISGIAIPKTKEKSYEMPTVEQIKNIVETEVSPKYDEQKRQLENDEKVQTEQLKEEIDDIEKAVTASLSEIRKNYGQAKENASSEAVKRGLARSSIILNQLQELEKGEISSIEDIIQRAEESKEDVNDEIKEITQNIMASLRSIDEKKASEIAKGIRELTKEYEKEQDEVFEYNNKLKTEKAQLIAELAKQGITVDEKLSEEYAKMISSKNKVFYTYYYSFGDKALEELEKDSAYLKQELGDKGYETLRQYFA